jgi:hypothetical protein
LPGLYVVPDVPLVSPEKYASAIWQKKPLPATSVKGKVVVAPPQLPLSARRRLDAIVMINISATTSAARNVECRFVFMVSPMY